MSQTTLFFWGSNQHSLLAPNSNKSFHTPQRTQLPAPIIDLSASEKHIAFITYDGSLCCYGLNLDGRLGIGAKPDVRCSINNPFKVKLPASAVTVKCGFSHTCVQLSNDELYSWGLGDYGALGTGQFKSRGAPGKVLLKGKIINFSCGAMHSGFVDSDGNILTCGSNQHGELGVARPDKIATPILLNFPHKAKQIQCGVFYTLLLTAKGQVYGMGNNKYGQLGIGHKVNECHPTLIRQLDNITVIAAGYHSGALDVEGSLYIWGSGSFGEILRPKKIILSVPLDRIFIRGFFGVAASTRHAKVFAWGNNTFGQLGRGNYESAKDPVQVSQLSNIRFHSFACGVNFFIAATNDNKFPKETSSVPSIEIPRNNYYVEGGRSTYNYGVQPTTPPPLSYEVAAAVRRSEERQRSAEQRTFRSPGRFHIEEEARIRSRSREDPDVRDIITQQIRRSRNRQSNNYEQLFVSLSADYEALLARFKAMQDHLQLKNRSLLVQKEELTLLFKDQNDLLRRDIEVLRHQLANTKEELRIVIAQQAETASVKLESTSLLTEINNRLNAEIKTLKDQFKITIKELEILQEENANKNAQITGLQAQILEKPSNTAEVESVSKELRLTKEELKQTNRKLQDAVEELAAKSLELKELKIKKAGTEIKEQLEGVKTELSEMVKANRAFKQQLRTANKKYEELQEQLAVKSLELKDLKQKKQLLQAQLKQQNTILSEEAAYLSKQLKITKDQLKITIRKMDSLEEQLALKVIQVKDSKQKRILYDATEEMKTEILAQRDDILLLSKDNKNLKEQLRNSLNKIEELEQAVASKATEAKDLKHKLSKKEAEFESLKVENENLNRDVKDLKEQLKKSLRELDKNEQQIATKTVELRQLKSKKEEEIKKLDKRASEAESDLSSVAEQLRTTKNDLRGSKDEANHFKLQTAELELTCGQLKTKQKKISQSLKETSRQLADKEKQLSEAQANLKKIENQLCKEISKLEDENIRITQIADKTNYQKKQYQEALRASEEAIVALEKHYQLQLTETVNNLIKMRQIQELNEIRVGQLKQIIDDEQKRCQLATTDAESARIKLAQTLEEKRQLFKMMQEQKGKHTEDLKIYKDKIIENETQTESYVQRIAQLEVQVAYEKQYHAKCEETIKDLTDQKDKVCRDQESLRQDYEKQKEKGRQLQFEVDKGKTLKKQVEVLTLQLERVESSTQQYRKQIEEVLIQKEDILKELRTDLEKKQTQLQKLQEKYDKDTGALNREVKDLDKKLSLKTKDCNQFRKQIERKAAEIDTLKDSIQKLNRKIAFKQEQFEKETKEHEKTTEEFNHLRRQFTKLKADKQEIENKNDQLVHEKEVLDQKIADKKRQIQLSQAQKKQLQGIIENLRKQNQLSKKDLEQANWALEDSRRINDELSKANKEFAENEEQFTSKIGELEGKVFELEDENRSYTPRYEALMERNRQLDERNRQLSEMINKAIEIQAEAYKTNILKEVSINTGEIIQQIKQQQQFKNKNRRKEIPAPRQMESAESENLEPKSPGLVSKIKDEPYTRLMQQKISMHKKKVSDSAQKLAGILDLNSEHEGKSFERSIGGRRQEDYQRINSHMQSLSQQKQEFMQKINSFAEKLKIL